MKSKRVLWISVERKQRFQLHILTFSIRQRRRRKREAVAGFTMVCPLDSSLCWSCTFHTISLQTYTLTQSQSQAKYETTGFLSKNRDRTPAQFVKCLDVSKSLFVKMFLSDKAIQEQERQEQKQREMKNKKKKKIKKRKSYSEIKRNHTPRLRPRFEVHSQDSPQLFRNRTSPRSMYQTGPK